MHTAEVLLDGPDRQPPGAAQRRDQAQQPDPEPRLTHHLTGQVHRWRPTPAALRTAPFQVHMRGDRYRRRREVNDFAGALH
jgi:hypothetical protein